MYCPRQKAHIASTVPIKIKKTISNVQYSLNSTNFGPLSSSPPSEWTLRLRNRLMTY